MLTEFTASFVVLYYVVKANILRVFVMLGLKFPSVLFPPSTEMKMGLKQSGSPFSPPEGASVLELRQVCTGLGRQLDPEDEGRRVVLFPSHMLGLSISFPG